MLDVLLQLLVLVFVASSMAGMGLGLTTAQILEPLKDRSLILRALALNFVVSPAIALALSFALGLDTPLAVGLVLISSAAGAPFLPKLVEVAKADIPRAVGLMVLLMTLTVVFLPVALPLLLPGVSVSPWAIAQSLLLFMLLPLAAGLFARARYGGAVDPVKASLGQAANVSLILVVGLGVVMNLQSMVELIGSRGLIAITLLVLALLLVGHLVGGAVLALATGQRNISAALLVAGQNFGFEVVTYIIVASLLSLVTLFVAAGEFGRRAKARQP